MNATSRTDADGTAGVGGWEVAGFVSKIGAGDAAAAVTCNACSGQMASGQAGRGGDEAW